MELDSLKQIIEALIFASDKPVTAAELTAYVDEMNGAALDDIIEQLNREYLQSGRSFEIVRVGGGLKITTRPEFANWIKKMYAGKVPGRLTQASLEALAIIAFKQPVSKTEVAAIRGVNSDGVVKNLLERKLIRIAGRSDAIGRPLLYGTTPEFLTYFGINTLEDLPKPREIEELFGEGKFADHIIETLSDEREQEDARPGEEAQNEGEAEAGSASEHPSE